MTLVVGYGNPLRCDDALGITVAQDLADLGLDRVDVLTTQQLHVEMLEDMIHYAKIILIDACCVGEEVCLKKIEPDSSFELASSHHLGPEMLFELARRLYQKELNLYMCLVRGENFGLGRMLSPKAQTRRSQAVELLVSLIRKGDLTYA